MKALKSSLILLGSLALFSCQHDPDEVTQIETTVTSLGSVGQAEVGIQDNKAVIITQRELDDELRDLVWLNTQTVFELKNTAPRLKVCLKLRQDLVDSGRFSVLDYASLEEFENNQDAFGVVAQNSEGEYRLIKKEGFVSKVKKQKELRRSLLKLQRAVQQQLALCDHENHRN